MNLGNHYSVKQFRLKIAGAFLVFLCCLGLMFGDISTVSAGLFSDGLAEIRDVGQTVALAIKKAVSSPASIIDSIKCFFGFDCPDNSAVLENQPVKQTVAGSLLNDSAGNIQEGPKPGQNGEADEPAENNALAIDPGAMPPVTGIYRNSITLNPEIIPALTPNLTPKLDALAGAGHLFEMTFEAPIQLPAENIVTYINTITNTVIVDEETKNKVNLILRQLDSDRPSYSLGSTYHLPDDLRVKTIDVNSGKFTVDKHGNISTVGDFEITGNFTVTGAQTFSGAAALNAATAIPLFSIEQGGTGAALEADNITLKGSTIATNDSDTSLLINPNGTGAVQFHSASNFIDSTGSLVLDGDVTLTSGGTFYTTGNGNLVFAPNGTGNLVVGETGNTAKIVPFEDSTIGYDLGALTARWFDIYAKGKLDIDSTTLTASQLSFIDTGKITTGASKDLTLQAGAAGKTRVTDGTDYVDITDGTQALYAVKGANAVKLANGTYAVDATGDVRMSGDITVNGGKIIFNGGNESIDNETAHLLKLATSGDAQVVLGDAAGVNQFQIKDSNGNTVASIDSDGKATLANAAITGSLGIGTADPQEALDVNGRVKLAQTTAPADTADKLYNVSGNLLWNGVNLTAAGGLPVGTEGQTLYNNAGVWTANSGLFYDDITGNVGIGTTAPQNALDVFGNGVLSVTGSDSGVNLYKSKANNYATGFNVYKRGTVGDINGAVVSGTEIGYHGFYAWDGTAYGRGAYAFVGATENWTSTAHGALYRIATTLNGSVTPLTRLLIDQSGNVGIGTMTPTSLLSVGAATSYASAVLNVGHAGTTYGAITMGDPVVASNGTGIYFRTSGTGIISTLANGQIQLTTAGVGTTTNGIRIDSAGNVGIGTTTPTQMLDVAGKVVVNGVSGNVGIGTTAPGEKLEIGGGNLRVWNDAALGDELASWVNNTPTYLYETFTPSGTDVTLENTTGYGIAYSRISNAKAGELYKITFNMTLNSGTMPAFRVSIGPTYSSTYMFAKVITAGTNTIYFYSPITVALYAGFYTASGVATNFTTSGFSLKKVVGGNIMASGLFVAGSTEGSNYFGSNVGIGTANPVTMLQVADTSTASPRGIMSSQYNTGTDGARFHMRKARGTLDTPAAVLTGDTLGKLVASGYDGSNYLEMGAIAINAEGTVATTRVPTNITFSTATNAAPSVLTEAMRIDSSGRVGIGTTGPGRALDIQGNPANSAFVGTQVMETGLNKGLLTGVLKGPTGTYDVGGLWFGTTVPSITNYMFTSTGTNSYFNATGGSMYFGINNVYAMTIGPNGGISVGSTYQTTDPGAGNLIISGNVGIGTTAPGAKLEVNGAVLIGNGMSAGAGLLGIKQSVNTNLGGITVYNSTGSGSIRWWVDSNGVMRLDNKSDASGNVSLNGEGSGNVGIGTMSPAYKLDVNGTFNASATSTFAGRVGIGTTAPTRALDVNGGHFSITHATGGDAGFEMRMTAYDFINPWVPNTTWDSATAGSMRALSSDGGFIFRGFSDADAGAMMFQGMVGTSGAVTATPIVFSAFKSDGANGITSLGLTENVVQFRNNATNLMSILGSGNVGIGTTAPSAKLSVLGADSLATTTVANLSGATGTGLAVMADGKVGVGTTAPTTNLDVVGGIYARTFLSTPLISASFMGVSNNLSFNVGASANYLFKVDNTEKVRIDSTGNVGIGTTGPAHKLDVVQTGTTTGLAAIKGLNSGINAGTAYGVFGTATGASVTNVGGYFSATGGVTNNYGLIVESGNVGIGTTGPGYKLTVNGTFAANSLYTAGSVVDGTGNSLLVDPSGSGIRFRSGGAGTDAGDIRFDAFDTERMRISSAGNVGIGTTGPTGPTGRLHVSDSLLAGTSFILDNNHATSNANNVLFYGRGAQKAGLLVDYSGTGSSDINFINNGSSRRMIIDSSGNVGIGTTGPAFALDVVGNIRASSAILGKTGTATNPSYTFSNDSNTGFFLAATDQIGFSIDGVEKMRIDSAGNVGIGTTAPGQALDVVGIIKNSSHIYVGGNLTSAADAGTGLVWPSVGSLSIYTNSVSRIRIDSSGNVGIGTTVPWGQLHITKGATGKGGELYLGNTWEATGNYSAISFNTTTSSSYQKGGIYYVADGSAFGRGYLQFAQQSDTYSNVSPTNYSGTMVLTNSGNVGIGTTGPGARLDVSTTATGSQSLLRLSGPNGIGNNSQIDFMAGTFNVARISTQYTAGGAVGLSFSTYSSLSSPFLHESMRIDNDGNVGIGTTSPLSKLDVKSGSLRLTASDGSYVGFHTDAGTTSKDYRLPLADGTNAQVLQTDGAGNLSWTTAGGAGGTGLLSFNGSVATAQTLVGAGIVSVADSGIGNAVHTISFNPSAVFNLGAAAGTTGMLTLTGSTSGVVGLTVAGTAGTGTWTLPGATDTVVGRATTDTLTNKTLTSPILTAPTLGAALGTSLALGGATIGTNALAITGTAIISGNVGIGTTGPTTKLHLSSDGGTNGTYITVQDTNVTNHGIGFFGIYSGNAFFQSAHTGRTDFWDTTNPRMTILEGGNVGIGTTGPAAILDVTASGSANADFRVSRSAGTYFSIAAPGGDNPVSRMTVNGTSALGLQNNGGVGIGTYSTLSGSAYPANGLIISGNVGIGTTGPGNLLEIAGGATGTETAVLQLRSNFSTTNTATTLRFVNSTSSNVARGAEISSFRNADLSNDLIFRAGTAAGAFTEYMRILGSGNVGIGTTGPLSKLHSKELGVKTAANYAGYLENIATNTTTDGINKYGAYITSTGDFSGTGGIATNNYGLYIDTVSGGDNNYGLAVKTVPTTANSANMYYDSATGIIYYNASSEKYKKDIQPLQSDYSKILSVSAKQWTYSSDNTLGIGFVAEDLEKLGLNELVIYNSAGQPDGIQFNRVAAYMLEAMKGQQSEIDVLKLVLGSPDAIDSASSTAAFAEASASRGGLASEGGIGNWLADWLESLGMGLQNGIASLKELVVGKITSNQVESEQVKAGQLCVGDTCVTQDEFRQLLEKNGIGSASAPATFAPVVISAPARAAEADESSDAPIPLDDAITPKASETANATSTPEIGN